MERPPIISDDHLRSPALIHWIMVRMCAWMGAALCVSGFVSHVALSMVELRTGTVALALFLAYLIVGILFLYLYQRLSYSTMLAAYFSYAVVTGVSAAMVGGYYNFPAVPHIFFIAAIVSVTAAVVGAFMERFTVPDMRWLVLGGTINAVLVIALYEYWYRDIVVVKSMFVGLSFWIALLICDKGRIARIASSLHMRGRSIDVVALACAFRLFLDSGVLGITLLGIYHQHEEGEL